MMPDPLARVLALYLRQAQPTGTPTPLGNGGGGSGARLWRFDSGLGPLVARLWPIGAPPPSALLLAHARLARLAPLPFVPIPLSTIDGRTLVTLDGRSWELAPWRPGLADPDRPMARTHLRLAFAALASVHLRFDADARPGPSPGLVARLAEAEGLLLGELGRIEPIVRRSPIGPVRDDALRWVDLARLGLPALVERLRREVTAIVSTRPVLRDARAEHFLFEGDRLTGLVDFGAIGVDSPATDLARLLSEAVGPDLAARAAALSVYASTRPIPPEEARLFDAFADSADWLGPARWVRWIFIEARRFDPPDLARTGLSRTLARLDERLRSSGPGRRPR